MTSTVVITDSRGVGLDQYLADEGLPAHVFLRSGAGIQPSVAAALPTIQVHRPRYIVVTTGICDVTYRNSQTKNTTLRYTSVKAAVDQYAENMRSAYSLLKS